MTDDAGERLTIRLDDDLSIVGSLPPAERSRVIVRLLCELVAYGASDAAADQPPP